MKKDKKLRSYTIVPDQLYVSRQADRHLDRIVEDMGRPGYVLVARQMGKTNLLLNAKRRRVECSEAFAYLDVSNVFPNIRSFFRNIVDVILETVDSAAGSGDEIRRGRRELEAEPHKEHERELRSILSRMDRKLVICLDEIDALTKSSYSDQVFSFIRSVYFSGRANFPVLGRLTYILSGVAEPADIIKNKDVSPFNIGEKIYLDDFSREECESLFSMAQLDFDAVVRDRVYRWTKGHPRMTWDLCAILEEMSSTSAPLVAGDVDESVRNLYFSSVDVPPVDHIRKLVAESKDIRDAIIAIHYGRTEAIADVVRTKLYLAGVSQFDPHTRIVAFKNPILEEALSEDYLLRLDASSEPSYEKGIELLSAGSYELATTEFLRFVERNPHSENVNSARFNAGKSSFKFGRYQDAILHLSKDERSADSESTTARDMYQGLAHSVLKEWAESVPYLERVVDQGELQESPEAYFEAKIALASAYIEMESGQSDNAFRLSEEAIASSSRILEVFGEGEGANRILSRGHLNLARSLHRKGQKPEAKRHFDLSLTCAPNALLPQIHLLGYALSTTARQRNYALTCAVEAIGRNASFSINVRDDKTVDIDTCLSVLLKLDSATRGTDSERTLDHIFALKASNAEFSELLNYLVTSCLSKGSQALAIRIIDRALVVASGELDIETRRFLWSLVILFNQSHGLARYAEEYISSLIMDMEAIPEPGEYRVLHAIMVDALKNGNMEIAESSLKVVKRGFDALQGAEPIYHSVSLLNEYLNLLFQLRVNPSPGVISQAKGFLARLSAVRRFPLPYFELDFARIMQLALSNNLQKVGAAFDVRRGRKIGRNDVVTVSYDSIKHTGKYKKFVDDLQSGVCRLEE